MMANSPNGGANIAVRTPRGSHRPAGAQHRQSTTTVEQKGNIMPISAANRRPVPARPGPFRAAYAAGAAAILLLAGGSVPAASAPVGPAAENAPAEAGAMAW